MEYHALLRRGTKPKTTLSARLSVWMLAITLSADVCASTFETQSCQFSELTPMLVAALSDGGVTEAPLDGVSLLVVVDGQVAYREAFGNQTLEMVLPVASVSKWFSGATVLAAVDAGEITLDDPLSQYLPAMNVPLKAGINFRQAFAHTAGLSDNNDIVSSGSLSLQQAAALLAELPNEFVPAGSEFYYGNASMHIAGAALERATGIDWDTLFRTRISDPLLLEATGFTEFGGSVNPMIGGGLASTLDDVGRFVAMIQNGGVSREGIPVLSEEAVALMLQNQSASPPIRSSPLGISDYGIGVWREEVDGIDNRARIVSSPGAFGTYPWIDFERGYFAVLMTNDRYPNISPLAASLRSAIEGRLDGDVTGDQQFDAQDTQVMLAISGPDRPNVIPRRDLDCDLDADLHDFAAYQVGRTRAR